MFKKILHQLAHRSEKTIDKITSKLGKPVNPNDIELVVYHHYATPTQITVSGRALKKQGITKAQPSDSIVKNFINIYRRIKSDEIPHLPLFIQFQNIIYSVTTDEEGYFYKTITLDKELDFKSDGLTFKVSLQDGSRTTIGNIYLPPKDTKFGVISDVDDTIMVTHATNAIRLAMTTFLKNATTREAFERVGKWYQLLKKGVSRNADNPFFYVSSSPWNLYDLISDFIDLNGLPKGSILLRDYGIDEDKFIMGTHGHHKKNAIIKILETYPTLDFILIGDSGQEDTFIYLDIAKQFPKRISAIFIRNVHESSRVAEAIEEGQKNGIPIHLIAHSDKGLEICKQLKML